MAMELLYNIRNGPIADAVNPASQMRTFFANFLKGPSLVLLLIALLVTIVAGVGILREHLQLGFSPIAGDRDFAGARGDAGEDPDVDLC